jgi:hypothetical protein
MANPTFEPLDQPHLNPAETSLGGKHSPALWLVAYGSYIYLSALLETLLGFLIRISATVSAGQLVGYYRTMNLIFGIMELAILLLVAAFVQNRIVRIVFSVLLGLKFLLYAFNFFVFR